MVLGNKTNQRSENKPIQHSGINLLPIEVIQQQKQKSKQNLANRFSVGMLVFLVFMTGIVFALRLMQDSSAQNVEDNIAHAQNEIGSLQEREGMLVSLKTKLGSIQGLVNGDSKSVMFSSVLNQSPQDLKLAVLSVEKSGILMISLSSLSVSSIETFLTHLQDPNMVAFKISKIDVDSFSKGKDGVYRVTLKITPEENLKK
jgi:hypothetical protein